MPTLRRLIQYRKDKESRCVQNHGALSSAHRVTHWYTDEPEEAAWAHFGSSFCNHGDYNCEAPGCSHAPREVVGSTGGPSGRIEHRWTEEEHFAGPECVNLTGYSSWDITVEEMKVSRYYVLSAGSHTAG